MPRLASFEGMGIVMHGHDVGQPHVHVYHQDRSAAVAISSGAVVDGALPAHQARLVTAWVGENREALLANWDSAKAGHPLERLPALSRGAIQATTGIAR